MTSLEIILTDAAYNYFPHRMCLVNPYLIWNKVVASLLIFLAYMSIPTCFLFKCVRRRWPFWPLVVLFIGFCGVGHLVQILTLTSPDYYWLDAAVDDLTVLFSVPAAFSMYRLVKLWQQRDLEQGMV